MNSNWSTPKEFFEKWNAVFHFTLDVCANQRNAKCKKFFTKQQDALKQDWGQHVCWMNPPYQYRETYKWMQKAYESSLRGAEVVCLVPSSTDSAWFHDWAVKGVITFIRGRLRFRGATGCGRAPFSNIVVYFGNNARPFLTLKPLTKGKIAALQGGR